MVRAFEVNMGRWTVGCLFLAGGCASLLVRSGVIELCDLGVRYQFQGFIAPDR